MAMFDPNAGWGDLGLSLAAAAAGRGLLMLRATRKALTLRRVVWTLAWEVPITASIGLLGWGLADWLNLSGGAAVVLVALLGRFGPDRLEPLLELLIPAAHRAKP